MLNYETVRDSCSQVRNQVGVSRERRRELAFDPDERLLERIHAERNLWRGESFEYTLRYAPTTNPIATTITKGVYFSEDPDVAFNFVKFGRFWKGQSKVGDLIGCMALCEVRSPSHLTSSYSLTKRCVLQSTHTTHR